MMGKPRMYGMNKPFVPNNKRRDMKVKLDKPTTEWFKQRPHMESTVVQCDKCGFYYKPSLGHICSKGRRNEISR